MTRKRETSKSTKASANDSELAAANLAARDFSSLAGYEGIRIRLLTLKAATRVPPVIMFVGRDGLGKRRLASFMSGLYACKQGISCGECGECRELIAGKNPEVLWLEPTDGPLKIEHVELLQEHLSYNPGTGSNSSRIVVIIDADRMTEQAANRMLKTLEEPPDRARVILTTSRPGALLPTILSRVVRWNVPPPERSAALGVLKKLVATTMPSSTESQLGDALDRAGGSPGRALSILAEAEAHAVAGEAVRRFLCEDDTEVLLRLAEEFARNFGWSAIQLADMCEWELNKIYQAGISTVNLQKLSARRAILSRVRWLAGRRQINLNTQLMAEGIALGRRVD